MHMYISPRPSNLGESREIMRLLSQFGEIEYYKNLKYESLSQPRSAAVIYKDEKAAEECLRRSPIRFRMGRVTSASRHEEQSSETAPPVEADTDASLQRGPLSTPFGLSTQTRSMSTSHNQLPRPPRMNRNAYMPFSSPPDLQPNHDSRIFEIVVNRSSRNYRERINHGHYHGTFAIDTKNVGQSDLARKVPTPGLSDIDWKHEEKPWHVTQTAKEQEYNGIKARKRLGLVWEESGHKAAYEEKHGIEGEVVEPVRVVGEKAANVRASRMEDLLAGRSSTLPDEVGLKDIKDDKLKEWWEENGLDAFAEPDRENDRSNAGYRPFLRP
jgi:hypothetical protein